MKSGGEIRLSISRGNGPQPARKYPLIPQKQAPPAPLMKKRIPVFKQLHEEDEEEGCDQVEDGEESPGRRVYALHASKFKGKNFEWGLVVLHVWLACITLYILFHMVFGFPGAIVSGGGAVAPILELKKDQRKFEVPFTLIADPKSNGRVMNLSLPQLSFESLIRYDVCCAQQAYYMCRAVTRNLGVDCYMSQAKEAVIHVIHPDMIGARCVIMWNERI